MKQRIIILLFGLGLFLTILVLSGSTTQPAQAESTYQVSSCGTILVDAANRAGIVANETEWFYDQESGPWMCDVEFNMDNDTRNESVRFEISQNSELLDYQLDMVDICGEDKWCHPTSFHGFPAIWREVGEFGWLVSPTGGTPQIGEMGYWFWVDISRYARVDQSELIALAEALSSAAEGKLPGAEVPPAGPVQSNSDCVGVTPEDLRAGGVAFLTCRLHCDPNSMSDDELQACINQYSGQSDSAPPVVPVDPGSEPPLIPDNPDTYIPPVDSPPGTNPFSVAWDSLPAGLIRNPLIPIAGGLTGAALAWFFSQLGTRLIPGSTQLVPTPQPITPAPAKPQDPKATVAPVAQVPPQPPPQLVTSPPLQTSPPPISANPPSLETATPSVATVEPPSSPFDLAFNLVKDTVSTVGNLSGLYEKFLTDPDSLKTVNIIRNAVKTLDQTPGVDTATDYLTSIAKTNALEKPGISKGLGYAGKVLDVFDAGMKAKKICEERGYSGWDAIFTTYAQVAEKGVVWVLTENPVVAFGDAVVGGATTMIFGVKNKIDIGVAVDKTHYVWDNVTKHASNWWNRSFETAANDAQIDDLRTLTQRIGQQVKDGKLSKQEGARRLRRVLDKVNQDSPLL